MSIQNDYLNFRNFQGLRPFIFEDRVKLQIYLKVGSKIFGMKNQNLPMAVFLKTIWLVLLLVLLIMIANQQSFVRLGVMGYQLQDLPTITCFG